MLKDYVVLPEIQILLGILQFDLLNLATLSAYREGHPRLLLPGNGVLAPGEAHGGLGI